MKLVPRAKPVKIRILSGGYEHSDLLSLKRHFNWEDISPLLMDGRLSKWLRRIGESEKAEAIKNTQSEDPELLTIYNKLFEENIHSIQDIVEKSVHDNGLLSLVGSLKKHWPKEDLIDALIQTTDNHIKSELAEILLEDSNSFDEVTSGQLLFEMGKAIYETTNEEKGIELIKKASKKGLREAQDFYKIYLKLKHPELNNIDYSNKLKIIISNKDIKYKIQYSWHYNIPIVENNMSKYRGLAKEYLKLSNFCLNAYKIAIKSYDNQEVSDYFIYELKNLKTSDYFFYEKKFLLGLFHPDNRIAQNHFSQIREIYPPADSIILKGTFNIGGKSFKRGHNNSLARETLEYFIKHLDKFRDYGKTGV